MTQPTREHRREIWSSVCLSYGVVSDILWRERLTTGQAVGTCSHCQQLLKPLEPEQVGPRPVYPARCIGCNREVLGVGPRPAKPKKGGE
jgi:hypothetical protein